MHKTSTTRRQREKRTQQEIAQVVEPDLKEFREELVRHARFVSSSMTQFDKDSEGMPERDQRQMLAVMSLQYNVTHEAIEAMDRCLETARSVAVAARLRSTKWRRHPSLYTQPAFP